MFQCKYCSLSLVGGASILRDHLVGGSRRRRPCNRVPTEVFVKVKGEHETAKEHKTKRLRKEDTRNDGRERGYPLGNGSQALMRLDMDRGGGGALMGPMGTPGEGRTLEPSTIQAMLGMDFEGDPDRAVGRYFYAHSVPHNHANSPYFKELCDAIARMPPGTFVMPSPHKLATAMLEAERDDLEKKVNIILKRFENTGCTLASNGWSDTEEDQIINVMALSDSSPVFLKSLDVGKARMSEKFIADFFTPVIEKVGSKNLVQIVMDDPVASRKAEEVLKIDYPHVFFTSCTVECIGSMIKAIEEEDWVKEVMSNSGAVFTFLQNLPVINGFLKEHPPIQCLKPRATRFAKHYLTLERLLRLRRAVLGVGMSEALDQWLLSNTRSAMKVKELISSELFWQDCDTVEACIRPLFIVLKNIDGDGPIMGEVYEWMVECTMELGNIDAKVGKARGEMIREIVASKWNNELHSPLHAVGRLLNPKWQSADFGEDMKCVVGFDTFLKKRVPEEERLLVSTQMKDFRAGTTGTFLMAGAMQQMEAVKRGELKPADWWFIWGAHTPELRRHAISILSQCSSSSSCEPTWSKHDTVYSKRRRNLGTKKMQDLIFCNFNLRLVDAYFQQTAVDERGGGATGTACREPLVEGYDYEDWVQETDESEEEMEETVELEEPSTSMGRDLGRDFGRELGATSNNMDQ